MARLLVLTDQIGQSPIPALGLLPHEVVGMALETDIASIKPAPDVIFVDATIDLVAANRVCVGLATREYRQPILLIMSDGGLAAVTKTWGATDLLLHSAGPAEIEARIRLALEPGDIATLPMAPIRAANLVIDESSYSAKLGSQTLDLTFKEFELLKFLAAHSGRVFTREQLLSEVWGYDYYGGTRTVDVHVRRLRAKLGEHEQLIGTVRNVGYQFTVKNENDDARQAVKA